MLRPFPDAPELLHSSNLPLCAEEAPTETLRAGGGRGGIRTHGTLAGTPVFKTGALNHSATLPLLRYQSLSDDNVKNEAGTKMIWPQLGPRPSGFHKQGGSTR